jgi:hypothetical protein
MEDLENLQAELSDEERAAAARMEKLLGPALEQYRRNEQEGLFDAL